MRFSSEEALELITQRKVCVMWPRKLLFFITGLLLGWGVLRDLAPAAALANGLALTPPMGWNSWYAFGCKPTEELIQQQVHALIRLGLRGAGYDTVIVDDCWAADRDSQGHITANANFGSGIPVLAAYLHKNRFKLGLYSSRGMRTCMDFTGSEDYEALDAQTFADWGVDYVKYDNCPYTQDGIDIERRYKAMRDGILATGRPMIFSISMWEFQGWQPETGHLSRTMGDIQDTWASNLEHFLRNSAYAAYAHPGYWNDPDVLHLGGGMTTNEYRTTFSLWALSAAPLIISANLYGLPDGTLKILRDKDVIAIDQDPLGVQAVQIGNSGPGKTVWSKQLSTGEYAVGLLNEEDETSADISFDGGMLGLGSYEVRDVWAKRKMGTYSGVYTASVKPHGIVLLRITPR